MNKKVLLTGIFVYNKINFPLKLAPIQRKNN